MQWALGSVYFYRCLIGRWSALATRASVLGLAEAWAVIRGNGPSRQLLSAAWQLPGSSKLCMQQVIMATNQRMLNADEEFQFSACSLPFIFCHPPWPRFGSPKTHHAWLEETRIRALLCREFAWPGAECKKGVHIRHDKRMLHSYLSLKRTSHSTSHDVHQKAAAWHDSPHIQAGIPCMSAEDANFSGAIRTHHSLDHA
jgi:hypothetical protein